MFAELSDAQLTALHSLLEEEGDRNRHEEGRVTTEEAKALDELMAGVGAEAYKRRRNGKYELFWWANG